MSTAISISSNLMPVVFIPHGGGPMPLLGEPNHKKLTAFLKKLGAELPCPTAIVVITAHWESTVVKISNGAKPHMMYDYQGFPQESYEFIYSAAGSPPLAQKIHALFVDKEIPVSLDSRRGFDHGTFVPLMLMYPKANIPVVQVSLLQSLDPAAHIAMGEVLAPLREEGILIIGSGMSFHNMRAFFKPDPTTLNRSQAFDKWLTDTLLNRSYAERKKALIDWQLAPDAIFCHPREEHLLPLHVCVGAAGETAKAEKFFSDEFFNSEISGFIWQD